MRGHAGSDKYISPHRCNIQTVLVQLTINGPPAVTGLTCKLLTTRRLSGPPPWYTSAGSLGSKFERSSWKRAYKRKRSVFKLRSFSSVGAIRLDTLLCVCVCVKVHVYA